jgi:hypothetical protein
MGEPGKGLKITEMQEVEVAVGYADNTWRTMNVMIEDLDVSISDSDKAHTAMKLAAETKALMMLEEAGMQDVCFVAFYCFVPKEEAE